MRDALLLLLLTYLLTYLLAYLSRGKPSPSPSPSRTPITLRCVTAFGDDSPPGAPSSAPGIGTRFCVKTDDDAYVHTVRLEVNLRALWDATATEAAAATMRNERGEVRRP